jgi:hypothetical protein
MPTLPTPQRNALMRRDRASGATIRQIASRYELSRSQAHRIVGAVEIAPPLPLVRMVLVPLPEGGFTARYTTEPGRPHKAYRLRHGRHVPT